MCRLKLTIFCILLFFSGSVSCWADTQDEPFSRRETVQESLDHCIYTIYQIRSGELTQEEGLDQLELTLDMIKFMTWFWIDD